MIEAALEIKMNLYYDIETFITDEQLKLKWEKNKQIIE